MKKDEQDRVKKALIEIVEDSNMPEYARIKAAKLLLENF